MALGPYDFQITSVFISAVPTGGASPFAEGAVKTTENVEVVVNIDFGTAFPGGAGSVTVGATIVDLSSTPNPKSLFAGSTTIAPVPGGSAQVVIPVGTLGPAGANPNDVAEIVAFASSTVIVGTPPATSIATSYFVVT